MIRIYHRLQKSGRIHGLGFYVATWESPPRFSNSDGSVLAITARALCRRRKVSYGPNNRAH